MLASQWHLNIYLPSLECRVSKLKLHSTLCYSQSLKLYILCTCVHMADTSIYKEVFVPSWGNNKYRSDKLLSQHIPRLCPTLFSDFVLHWSPTWRASFSFLFRDNQDREFTSLSFMFLVLRQSCFMHHHPPQFGSLHPSALSCLFWFLETHKEGKLRIVENVWW